ncbi:SDR family NAD(P)-dependent oxidoreductase [Pedobacter sp. HMF7647]|uniref:SDR family NAD(P)-dependent oxidoreductase n=1 Tax=Hufsiella arboris TaxID=2695275 RepID=A0A7K1YDM1_9SPHI|nr:SDR family oxidoreductase [Hufsiella arboris]MXV52694.1 SDR family NAD(P)-dependent oxidoreductase [Hufsiella arboris]
MNFVITGASSGVGFEAVLELILDSSNQVVALARSEDKLQRLSEIARSLNPDCSLYPAKFDIVHDDYNDGLIPFIKQFLGKVDVLINNAGQLINKPFIDTSALDFAEMLQSNLLGHVKMIQQLLPLINSGGHIVNIGSMGGFTGSIKFPGLAAYSASKAALHTLTECLAMELSDQNIKVNCLALGSAQTEMLEQAFPDYESPIMAFEMGKYIADFAKTGGKFFNGKILPVAVTTP